MAAITTFNVSTVAYTTGLTKQECLRRLQAQTKRGFWTRLADLRPPSLFVWGEVDRLVPVAFARHVAEALPSSSQVVLPDCGHVPQVELAERTNALLRDHLAAAGEIQARRAA